MRLAFARFFVVEQCLGGPFVKAHTASWYRRPIRKSVWILQGSTSMMTSRTSSRQMNALFKWRAIVDFVVERGERRPDQSQGSFTMVWYTINSYNTMCCSWLSSIKYSVYVFQRTLSKSDDTIAAINYHNTIGKVWEYLESFYTSAVCLWKTAAYQNPIIRCVHINQIHCM